MFSLDKYYDILKANFLKLQCIKTFSINQNINDLDYTHLISESTDKRNIWAYGSHEQQEYHDNFYKCIPQVLFLFSEQEPLYYELFEHHYQTHLPVLEFKLKKEILVNSEISSEKQKILKDFRLVDWYFFFHGFAALSWFNNLKYQPKIENSKSKVFSCYNNLISGFRSYRLLLVSHLNEKNLLDKGSVSCNLNDQFGSWTQSVKSEFLSKNAKIKIFNTFSKLNSPLIADQDNTHGALSAEPEFTDINQCHWHVVTETVFFQEKLHLTEKVFKPIVNRLPFILVAAPGNLAYLKSYGFKTFDQWIDESYDNEKDPEKRIEMIVHEIEKLCNLSNDKLNTITEEIQEVVDYNFNWFYGGFKELIVNEMVDNYSKALDELQINHSDINLDEIKHRLKQ